MWTLAPTRYPGAHYATFPPELPRLAIQAGTSAHGVCPTCGAPWVRQVERTFTPQADVRNPARLARRQGKGLDASNRWASAPRGATHYHTIGWRPGCKHDADPVPAVVLDPFAGVGTTLGVALQLGRAAVGIEVNLAYVALARERIRALAAAR